MQIIMPPHKREIFVRVYLGLWDLKPRYRKKARGQGNLINWFMSLCDI